MLLSNNNNKNSPRDSFLLGQISVTWPIWSALYLPRTRFMGPEAGLCLSVLVYRWGELLIYQDNYHWSGINASQKREVVAMRWTSGLLQRKRKNPTDNKNECFGKSKIISFLLLSRGARRGLTQSPAESVFYQCGDKNKIWLDLAPHGHRLCHIGLVVGGWWYVLRTTPKEPLCWTRCPVQNENDISAKWMWRNNRAATRGMPWV